MRKNLHKWLITIRFPVAVARWCVISSCIISCLVVTPAAMAMTNTNFSIPKLAENNGSGFRVGQTHQLTNDVISGQPVATSTSINFSLHGQPMVLVDTDKSSCGVFINKGEYGTNVLDVELSLICGHPSGCTDVELSNNGVVGWQTFPYTTTRNYTLPANDGNRSVYARYINGLGNTSGVCSDSIILDRIAPVVGISPTGGTYFSPQSVALTPNEPATVKYTDDATDPKTSPSAIIYANPVTVSTNGTLSAFAQDPAGNVGNTVSETYEICGGTNLGISGSVIDGATNKALPLVVITLDKGQVENTNTNGDYAFTGLARNFYTIESITTPVPGYATYQKTLKLCETSVVHDIVLTKSATVFGKDTNSGYSSDGVNTSTGNFTYGISDLALPGIGPSVVFDRTYNSQDPSDGPLGFGWNWNYNSFLSAGPDGELVVRWGDGKTEVWAPDGGGGFTPMYGVFSTLVDNLDGTYTLRRKDLVEFHFDVSGKLAKIVDEYGNEVLFSFTGADLTTITDTAGRVITLSYDANGRITNVLDPISRSVSFTYDGSGNMVTSTNLEGGVTTYSYDFDHQMLTLVDPLGHTVLTNVFDTSRRVITSQRDALGGETRYVYDVPTKTTTIQDALSNTYFHRFDDRLRLVEETDAKGFITNYTYDSRGNMVSVTDKNGNTTTYQYDANGNVIVKTEPLGRATTATFDSKNNPLTKTDARGFSQVFEYDPANGNLLVSYDCDGVPAAGCATDPTVTRTEYGYDPSTGQLTTVTEAAGHPTLERTTTYQYDVSGNQVAVLDAMGSTSNFTFDGVGRKSTESHPLGRASAYEYDAMDRMISTTNVLGDKAFFIYDANGNKLENIDENSHSTLFEYDLKDRLFRITDPMGGIETYVYDALDRRTGLTNARGRTSTINYDAVGNVIRETDAVGASVQSEYDANGNRISTTDAKGNTTTFVLDALSQLIAVTDPLGNTVTYEYDAVGNRTKVINALGEETTTTYDPFNRVATVTDHLGNTITNTYDGLGRLISVVDARGNQTDFAYDLLDRLTGVTDNAGSTLLASYDMLGNRLTTTDTRGNQTTYAYDLLDRLTTETDPLGSAEVRTFDKVGNLKTLMNADGTSSYIYDLNDRLTGITFPDFSTAAYTYDANGNRESVVDSAGPTTYSYDNVDRIASVQDPFGNQLAYTYDGNGNRNSIRYPGFRVVSYLFDELNRLIQVDDWGGVTTTYTFDDAGRLSGETMGNGATVSYSYDGAGRLISKLDKAADNTIISNYVYTLDANGNRTALDLTQPLMADLDKVGITFNSNVANQVVSNNATTYTYDGKGNRISKSDTVGTTNYTYNFDNRLTQSSDATNTSTNTYTSNGTRLASTKNGQETRYLLDLNSGMENVIADLNGSNTVLNFFILGDGLLYSIDGVTGERHYFHFDPLGNTIAMTDNSGAMVNGYAYYPFGKLARIQQGLQNSFNLGGKFGVREEQNGLYFMRARYYDPETRTFLSKDQVQGDINESQTINRYAYANNNPISFVDPDGKWIKDALQLIADVTKTGIALNEAYQNPSLLNAAKAGKEVGGLAITVAKLGIKNTVKFSWGVFLGLAEESYSFGKGIAQGVTGDNYDKNNSSGGNFVGYVVGGWVRAGVHAYKHGQYKRHPELDPFNRRGSSGPDSSGQGDERSLTGSGGIIGDTASAWSGGIGAIDSSKHQLIIQGGEVVVVRKHRPKKYLNVAKYARRYYNQEFSKILDPDYLDNQTLSYVESRINGEIAGLQRMRFGYRSAKQKEKAKARRAWAVRQSGSRLYAQLLTALSKHQVLIVDMAKLPSTTIGGIQKSGVFAGN